MKRLMFTLANDVHFVPKVAFVDDGVIREVYLCLDGESYLPEQYTARLLEVGNLNEEGLRSNS